MGETTLNMLRRPGGPSRSTHGGAIRLPSASASFEASLHEAPQLKSGARQNGIPGFPSPLAEPPLTSPMGRGRTAGPGEGLRSFRRVPYALARRLRRRPLPTGEVKRSALRRSRVACTLGVYHPGSHSSPPSGVIPGEDPGSMQPGSGEVFATRERQPCQAPSQRSCHAS